MLSKLGPFKWTIHNIIAHPISEIAYLLGAKGFSTWIHDITIPED